ncbi:restriction endonuclease subunit S [Acinetobacter guerrae]|uniref:restriction endonuclease subunit S n=1 Tax=Acinetobacter guerrae TaxID=1843371 RepID=UPI0019D6A2A8|nr:restriction endonuclease subunit S [Acinetobacter guerrae]
MMIQSNLTFTENQKISEGYKKTEVGVIPNDWEVLSINDFAIKVGSGKTPKGGAQIYKKSGYPFVRSQNIGWGILDLSDVVYISKEVHENFHGNDLKNDDVLLNITGASIGRCAKADYRISGGNVNQHVCIIRSNPDTANSDLLVEIINSKIVQTQINSYQAGGNREGLNFSQVRQLQIPMSKKAEEQLKIALVLNDVNALISELEKLIEKKQAIKTATMQQLLTGKTRLPEFTLREDGTPKAYKDSELGQIPEDWMALSIGSDTSLKARIGWQALTTAEYLKEGNYYLVTGTDFNGGLVNWNSCCYVSEWRYKQDKNIQLQEHDVLVTKDGTIGKVGFIESLPLPATLNSGVFVVRPKLTKCLPRFLFYILTSSYFDDFVKLITAGSTIVHLYQKDFVNFKFYVPHNIEEQSAIANILADLDAELAKLNLKLDKFKNIKQGMMQELLTGKTRVV